MRDYLRMASVFSAGGLVTILTMWVYFEGSFPSLHDFIAIIVSMIAFWIIPGPIMFYIGNRLVRDSDSPVD